MPSRARRYADKIKGSAVSAAASWGSGMLATLSHLAGQTIQLRVTMADATLLNPIGVFFDQVLGYHTARVKTDEGLQELSWPMPYSCKHPRIQ